MNDDNVEPIEFDAGETVTLGFTCELDHAPVDITGYKFFFTLRAQPDPNDATDANALLKKDNDTVGGITITVAAAGEGEVLLSSANTKGLPTGINLSYDLRSRSGAGVINTVASGQIVVNAPDTNRI